MGRTSDGRNVRGGNTSGGLDGRFFWGIDESLRQATGGYHYIGGAGGQALFNILHNTRLRISIYNIVKNSR